MYKALSDQQRLTIKDKTFLVNESNFFVFDMRQKEKGYFPSFEDKFSCEYDDLIDVIHYSRNYDLVGKFDLLANLELPEFESGPQNDTMFITSISDIKGDFDAEGNLHIQSMNVEQKSDEWFKSSSYTQKLTFDFQTGELHVMGIEKQPKSSSQYAYHIPIEQVDGRILDVQKQLDSCNEKLNADDIPLVGQILVGKEIERINNQLNQFMIIDGSKREEHSEPSLLDL